MRVLFYAISAILFLISGLALHDFFFITLSLDTATEYLSIGVFGIAIGLLTLKEAIKPSGRNMP